MNVQDEQSSNQIEVLKKEIIKIEQKLQKQKIEVLEQSEQVAKQRIGR